MFNIVKLVPGGEPELLMDESYDPPRPYVFEDGAAAAREAAWRSQYFGKHQVRPVPVTDAWRDREAARFASGEYRPLPWVDQPWWKGSVAERDHFAHVSVQNDCMVAFTESPQKGSADRQTRVRPGVYLQRFFGDVLDGNIIRDLATAFLAEMDPVDLKFARTPDEIEHVYRNGPHSCMAHSPSYYSSPIHPVRVYGAGDLAVAYIERDGRITGRVLCWPDRKLYSRPYGDWGRLGSRLEALGYSDGELIGARLLKVEGDRNRVVMPYIDETLSFGFHPDGKHLCIGGDYDAETTSGLAKAEEYSVCEYSDHRYPAHEMVEAHWTLWNGRHVEGSIGQEIADEYFVLCEETDELWHADNVIRLHDGCSVSPLWAEDNTFTCPVDDEIYRISEGVEVDGTLYGPGNEPEQDEDAEELLVQAA